ncbi:MAG TPA: hypothetical protein VHO01_09980 [Jatrophihabitans sp.]|nr:hypothetical protein [Jatrophihabitans sp.]
MSADEPDGATPAQQPAARHEPRPDEEPAAAEPDEDGAVPSAPADPQDAPVSPDQPINPA